MFFFFKIKLACYLYKNTTTNDAVCIGLHSFSNEDDTRKGEPWPHVGTKLSKFYNWIKYGVSNSNDLIFTFCIKSTGKLPFKRYPMKEFQISLLPQIGHTLPDFHTKFEPDLSTSVSGTAIYVRWPRVPSANSYFCNQTHKKLDILSEHSFKHTKWLEYYYFYFI